VCLAAAGRAGVCLLGASQFRKPRQSGSGPRLAGGSRLAVARKAVTLLLPEGPLDHIMNPSDASLLALSLLAGAVFCGPILFRLIAPTPPDDIKTITLFLGNREETPVTIRKMWVGGPARESGRSIYLQTGRPYRVTARSGDGRIWIHILAADGTDALGHPKLKQLVEWGWATVAQ
jgi:hypothetical protein